MARETIKQLIKKEILKVQKDGLLPKFDLPFDFAQGKPEIEIECPAEKEFGDYSTNLAMRISKLIKKPPMEIAEILLNQLLSSLAGRKMFSRIEIKGPGFINFFLSENYLQEQVREILEQKNKFGDLKFGKKELASSPTSRSGKVQVEFISANPTGPLTLGNGRGAFLGDVLANVLNRAGFRVEREYYINDVGEQILKLGHSVIGDEQAVYRGKYIDDLRKRIKSFDFAQDEKKDVEKAGQWAAKIILGKIIKPFVSKKLKIKFDKWFSEKTLYDSGAVNEVLEVLKKKGLTYEKDGALWFRTTDFGDDKDRVLIKADGEKTYLASDIAYMKNKFERGFKKLIYIWGADHFGYIARMKAAAQAFGYSPEDIEIIIVQLVRLIEKGKEVRMSKRRGIYILLEDLIDEIGLDAARFFFLTRAADSHFNFDLGLAKEQSEKNPVYYIQYASARIESVKRKAPPSLKLRRTGKSAKQQFKNINYKLLNHPDELNLIKQLIRFPEIIEDTAGDYQVQRLPRYALDLVTVFHKFYESCRVITEDKNLTQARLGLVEAVKIVLKNVLDLLGIAAPKKM